jgi:amino acid adenylation domain-containing protein
MQDTKLKGYRLSMQQDRLYRRQGEDQIWYTQCAVQLSGKLNRLSLFCTLQDLVKRHDILRTTFRRLPGMEIPVQVVIDTAEVDCPVIDLENLSAVDQTALPTAFLASMQKKVTRLEVHPLLTIELVHLSAESHLLLISLPALCADEYTLMQMVSELGQIYASTIKGMDASAEEPLQYADVAAWQEQLLESEEAKALPMPWDKIDISQLAAMRLPFVQQIAIEGDERSFSFNSLELPLEENISALMGRRSQQYKLPVESWLLACWATMLWRLNGMQAPLIGVVGNGRMYEDLTEELARALGFYARVVPVETRPGEDFSFEQVARSISKTLSETMKRQIYFSWEDVAEGDIVVDGTASPVFPLCFEYIAWPGPFTAGEIEFSLSKSYCCFDLFALKLSILQAGRELQLRFQYNPDKINAIHVERLASSFLELLQSSLELPRAKVSTLSLLEPETQLSLLAVGCAPRQVIPSLSLHQLFEAQVQRYPNNIAAIDSQEQMTYHQLNAQANRLACALRQRGVGPGAVVGLCLPRQVHMLVGLLGVLKAGGAYLPLDTGIPTVRMTYQLQENAAGLLLTQEAVRPHLPEWEGDILSLEELEVELAQASMEDQSAGTSGEDLAYIIYTSGSTGVPKGVMVRQSSIVNYTQALCELLGAEPGWQYATVSTLAADLGNTAIFCALASGGCVQILDYETATSGEAMANWATMHPIDVLKIVPSHLSALLESQRAQELLPRRALVLGGETLSWQLVERMRQVGGACQVYNHYGPTETTIGVLVNPLGALEQQAESPGVALGYPLINTQVYVLDRWMQPVPEGIVGELYIGGAGVALGYQQKAEQTAERFVPHPYSQQPGDRLYRTGDLVRYGEEGKIIFVGRNDGQVKLRGYRIEVGEIEEVLRRHPLVRDCAVQLQQEGPGAPRLIGYVVARTDAGLSSQSLQEALGKQIPEYMVPSDFVMLERLPLTANGKLDRWQLPQPAPMSEHVPEALEEPRSPIEEMLVQIWQDVLLLPDIGIDDNFFTLGGHSLLATRVMARLQAIFQVVLPVQMLFEAPTVAGLARQIEQELLKDEGIEIPPPRAGVRPDEIPLSFAQQRLWFMDQLEPGSVAYLTPRALHFSGDLSAEALEQSLEGLIQRHESLRTTFEERAGRPVQVIHPAQRFTLPVIDLQGLQPVKREAEIRSLASQEALRPCDLAKGPLLRVYLLRQETQEHVVLLTLHHIITDRWSIQILVRELTTLYQLYRAGQPLSPVPLPIQYADYALWQRQWLQGDVLEKLLQYWKDQLAPPLPLLNLPTDYARTPLQSSQGATSFFQLPMSLASDLNVLGQQESATLFMVLLAAFAVLLHYHSGQDDLIIGTDIANRNQVETEGLIGFFVNQLVLRIDLAHNPDFLEIIRRVRDVSLKAYTYQDLPFDRLVDALNVERDLSRTPLFQVKFVLQNVPRQQVSLPNIEMKPLELKRDTSKFDLLLNMVERGHELVGWLEYRTDLFKEETIAQFLRHFETIISHVVALPATHLEELEAALAADDSVQRAAEEQALQQRGLQKLKQTRRKAEQRVN